MSAWIDRMELARQAWSSELRLVRDGIGRDRDGMVAVGFWAKTWHWSGGISEVCLHDHAIIDLENPLSAEKIAALIANVREACERARRDYSDKVPMMLHPKQADGRLHLGENTRETLYLRDRRRDIHPTEDLPEDIEGLSAGDGNGLIRALAEAARQGLHVEDRLDPSFGAPRLIQDCKHRRWGYRLRLSKREFLGKKVVFAPGEISSTLLHEAFLSSMVENSEKSLHRLFLENGPGGTHYSNQRRGLPAGYQWLEDRIALEASRNTDRDPEIDL